MKRLKTYVEESIFDMEDKVENFDQDLAREEIWKDLTQTYGEILMGWRKLSIDNIGFDDKGRIIFKNWPGPVIEFYLGSMNRFPVSIEKRGFGDLDPKILHVVVKEFRGKLSQLPFRGKYNNKALTLEKGSMVMDEFPKFSRIMFDDVYLRNIHILPKKQPKYCTIEFSDSTASNLILDWSDRFFKGNYALRGRGNYYVECK